MVYVTHTQFSVVSSNTLTETLSDYPSFISNSSIYSRYKLHTNLITES